MSFQPTIILFFSTELQPIYLISKQEESVNQNCNLQAINFEAGRSMDVLWQDWRGGDRD